MTHQGIVMLTSNVESPSSRGGCADCLPQNVIEHNLLPYGLGFRSYLWVLLFVAVYSKNKVGRCLHLLGRGSKTVRVKTQFFIVALHKLSYHVASH